MKKFNKKGFTLLELLIAIAIFTSIIFICYSIFNKFLMLTKDQLNINQGQLTVNDMNEYLTKDLEKTSSIALYLDNNEIAKTTQENTKSKNNEANAQQDVLKEKIDSLKEKLSVENNFEYSYKIKFKGESTQISKSTEYDVIYTVSITKKYENSYKYTIIRTDTTDGVSITFVNDETVTKKQSEEFKVPFTIEGTNPYKVSLGYNGKNDEFVKKEFTIASILNELGNGTGGDGNTEENPTTPTPSPDEIKPPPDKVEPPEQWGGNIQFNTLGFWTADSTIKSKDNLYTWVSSETEIMKDAYADQEDGKNDEFNIEGYVKYNNNTFTGSYIGYNEIKNDYGWQGQVKDISIGSKQIKRIAIYVSKDTILKDFKIESDEAKITIDEITLRNNDSINLGTGWHFCKIELNNKSLLNFKFTGKLSIDKSKVSSGYAYVAYEKDDYKNTSNLRGDLIFEFSNFTQGSENHWTNFTSTIKYKKDNMYITEDTTPYPHINVDNNNIKNIQINIIIKKDFKYIEGFTQPSNIKYYINQGEIDKDISKICGMRIFSDTNITILSESIKNFENKGEYFECTFNNMGNQPSMDIKIDCSQIKKNGIDKGSFYIEFIEDK